MGKLRNILNNDYAFSIINKVTGVFFGVLSTVFINRYLSPEMKGEYAYILNNVNLIAIIANMGFYQSYPYSRRSELENCLGTYINAFFLQFVIYLALAIAGIFVLDASIYVVALFLVPVQVLTSQLAMIALVDFLKYRQKLQIISQLVNLLVIICIFFLTKRNVLYVIAALFLKDFLFIAAYMAKIRQVPNPIKVTPDFIKFLFKFGVFAMLSTLLINMNYKLDVLILKMYVNYTEIGLYSVGAALAEYAWLIPDAFKDVLFSRTARSDSIDEIVSSLRINLFLTAIILAGVLVLGRYAIIFLYGSEFAGAYGVTCIIFMGVPSMVLYKLTNPLYLANGKQKFYFTALLVSVIINVIANFIIIPHMGKEGAAIASVISYAVCGLIFYIKFIQDYSIRWYDPLILKRSDINKLKALIGTGQKKMQK